MTVTLRFAPYFQHFFETKESVVELPPDGTVGDAIDAYFAAHPEHLQRAEQQHAFLLGKFRAVYIADGVAATADYPLSDGVVVTVLRAAVGG